MFKTCSDPDFNWVHCLCDSATWVVKEPGKPIGFFYSRLFDDALSPSGLGFAVDAFRIDEDGTLDDFYSDILWDYGAADELIAAYPNKFSCAVRCDGLNPYDIPTSWSQGKGERYRARDTVLAAVDMLTDEADEAGIDACPEFWALMNRGNGELLYCFDFNRYGEIAVNNGYVDLCETCYVDKRADWPALDEYSFEEIRDETVAEWRAHIAEGVVEKPVTPTDLARSASAAAATSAVIASSANQTAPKL